MKSYLRLLAYIGPYKKRLAEAFVCIVVAAAANLYLDIINLFLRILQIMGRRRD